MPHAPLISDDELLALVEQRPIAPERQGALRQALANDPALVQTIRAMRVDMLALQSLADAPEARAPVDLLAGVEARLEREALVGLSTIREPDDIEAPIPISSIQPRGRSFVDHALRSPWTGRLAIAAAIALVGVGAYVAVSPLLRRPHGGSEIARGTGTPDLTTPTEQPAQPDPRANNLAPRPLVPTIDPSLNDDTPDAMPFALTGPVPSESLITPGALANPVVTAVAEVSLAEAFAAAQDGRLIIRLHAARPGASNTPDTIARRLETLSARAPLSPLAPRLTTLSPTAKDAVLAMAGTHHAVIAAKASRPTSIPKLPGAPNTPNVAGERGTSASPTTTSLTGPNAPAPVPSTITTPAFDPSSVYAASILTTELSLDHLKRLLSTGGTEVVFDILPPGTPAQPTANGENAPESAAVFWWNQPPRTWSPRLTVPVLVQINN